MDIKLLKVLEDCGCLQHYKYFTGITFRELTSLPVKRLKPRLAQLLSSVSDGQSSLVSVIAARIFSDSEDDDEDDYHQVEGPKTKRTRHGANDDMATVGVDVDIKPKIERIKEADSPAAVVEEEEITIVNEVLGDVSFSGLHLKKEREILELTIDDGDTPEEGLAQNDTSVSIETTSITDELTGTEDEVEEILKNIILNNDKEYFLVKWKGYPDGDTWETRQNLTNCPEAWAKFQLKQERKEVARVKRAAMKDALEKRRAETQAAAKRKREEKKAATGTSDTQRRKTSNTPTRVSPRQTKSKIMASSTAVSDPNPASCSTSKSTQETARIASMVAEVAVMIMMKVQASTAGKVHNNHERQNQTSEHTMLRKENSIRKTSDPEHVVVPSNWTHWNEQDWMKVGMTKTAFGVICSSPAECFLYKQPKIFGFLTSTDKVYNHLMSKNHAQKYRTRGCAMNHEDPKPTCLLII